MTQNQKLRINIALIMLAYAYAFSQETAAALTFALLSAVTAVLSHSLRCVKVRLSSVLVLSALQILWILASGLEQVSSLLPLLALMNSLCAGVWMESSWKAVSQAEGNLNLLFGLCLCLALAVPQEAIRMLCVSADRWDLVQTVCLIFLPLSGCCLYRRIRFDLRHRKTEKTQVPVSRYHVD